MLLTYNEFAEIVPKETLEFVNKALPMIDSYIKLKVIKMQKGSIDMEKRFFKNHQNDFILAVFLYNFYEINPKYASLLANYGYDNKMLEVSKQEAGNMLTKIFQDYCAYFCFDKFLYDYQVLTPTAIISNLIYEYKDNDGLYIDPKSIEILCNRNLPRIHKALIHFNIQEKQEIIDKIKMRFNTNLSIEIINYLETASKIHQIIEESKTKQEIPSYITSKKDIEVISLFLALFYSKNTKERFKNYFHHIGINEQTIQNSLNIENLDKKIEETQENYLLLQLYYDQYKGKNMQEMLKKLTDRKLFQSVALEILLNNLNQDMSVIKNLTNSELLEKIETTTLLDTLPPKLKEYLENTIRIYSRLHKHFINSTSYNTNLITQKEDITLLSIIIALFYENEENYSFLEKNGITLQTIATTCEIDFSLLQNITREKIDYQILKEEYQPIIKQNPNLEINDFLKLFLNKSSILERMMSILGKSYFALETEITTGMEQMPSLEERYTLLANMEIPPLDPNDMNSIVNFGNDLLSHSEFINSKTGKLILNREMDVSSDLTMEITNKISLSIPSPKKRKLLFTKHLLFLKKTISSLTSPLKSDQDLDLTINKIMNALQQAMIEYDQILKFWGLFQQKIAEHLFTIQEVLNQTEEENLPNNSNIAVVLQNSTHLGLIEDKKSAFEKIDTYITAEIIRINQAIMDHSVSLKALTISKQSLLPLAKTALALMEGQKNDQYASNIYFSSLELCKNLFNKNVEGTMANIETLKQVIPENTFNKIENDVNAYLSLLQNITPNSTPVPKIG